MTDDAAAASIVPGHWAEAKARRRVAGSQFTIQRFGWSDVSEAEALRHAQARVDEAVAELERTGSVRRRDHRISYNGAEGLPIREEVVARAGADVITRNGYGALCLNTPDVLFADIDHPEHAIERMGRVEAAIWLIVMGLLGTTGGWGILFALALGAAVFTRPLLGELKRRARAAGPSDEERALARIEGVSANAPELNLHVYRTPAGLRVLVLDRPFDPRGEDAHALLKALGSDPIYVQMCRNQSCFRARLTPKPWRIGVRPMPARTSVWPLRSGALAARTRWVTAYEAQGRDFAACRFLTRYGSEALDPRCAAVRTLHDDYSHANDSQRPLA